MTKKSNESKVNYKEDYCDGCEGFTNQYQTETHFPEWHQSTWVCIECDCVTHEIGG